MNAKEDVGGGNLWDPDTAKTMSGLDEQEPTSDGTRRIVMVSYGTKDVVTVYLFAGRN